MKGFRRTVGKKRIAIAIPDELFEKIAKRAKDDNVPFTVKAVELLSCGILDYEESERFEPEVVAQREAKRVEEKNRLDFH
jgi:hypothetical protein